MKNIWTIYTREISSYFNSLIAYLFIFLFVVFLAFLFFVVGDFFGQATPDIRAYFFYMHWVMPVFIPAVTMRLWSEEKRMGTIELLMTMPMKSWQLVLGKFFAGYTVIIASLALTLVVPLTLTAVTNLDWGSLFATYVGAIAISSVYLALGSWISTWTQNQIVTLLTSIVCCVVLAVIGFQHVINFLDKSIFDGLGSFVGWFGTLPHYQEFLRGLVNPVGFVYAASVTAFFLTLNNAFVEGRKY